MIIKIETASKINIYVVQIAGLIARRIKCNLDENQNVSTGERLVLLGLEVE